MTEKKMNPDRELTPEEQQQLEGEEQFFKQQFSSLPSPKLPGSLSAQAMWEKICAGEGDHQITVDPTQMEPPAPQKPEGKVLDFPGSHKTEEKPKRNLTVHRRRWAIACTLVLVVGLSAAYWKWQRPMEQMKDMVTAESAAEQPVEEVAEEAAEDTASVESANRQPSLKMGVPKTSAQTEQPAEEPQEEPQVAAADTQLHLDGSRCAGRIGIPDRVGGAGRRSGRGGRRGGSTIFHQKRDGKCAGQPIADPFAQKRQPDLSANDRRSGAQ